jgi:hypothetical protein
MFFGRVEAGSIESVRRQRWTGPMIREADAHFIRTVKLAVIAGAIDLCLVGASFLLRGNLREITAGGAAGLTLSTALMLVYAYRRRGPAEANHIAVARRAAQNRAAVAGALLLGTMGSLLLRSLGLEWLFAGFFTGLFGFFALMIGPLFWTRPTAPMEASPRAQMTRAERAVNLHYE